MLHVLENEISLLEWSGDTAQLRIFEGTMISFLWILAVFTHFHDSFASLQNSVISVTKENFPRNSGNCFRKKQITKFYCKIGNQLFNKFSVLPLVSFLLLFCSKNLTKEKDCLECHVWNFQHFLKCTKQIKISMVIRKNYFQPVLRRQLTRALQYCQTTPRSTITQLPQKHSENRNILQQKSLSMKYFFGRLTGTALRHPKVPDSDSGLSFE